MISYLKSLLSLDGLIAAGDCMTNKKSSASGIFRVDGRTRLLHNARGTLNNFEARRMVGNAGVRGNDRCVRPSALSYLRGSILTHITANVAKNTG